MGDDGEPGWPRLLPQVGWTWHNCKISGFGDVSVLTLYWGELAYVYCGLMSFGRPLHREVGFLYLLSRGMWLLRSWTGTFLEWQFNAAPGTHYLMLTWECLAWGVPLPMLSRHTQHRNVTNSPVTRKLSSRGHVRCGLCHKLVTLTLTKVFILLVLFF